MREMTFPLSIGEWMDKIWHMYIMEYYLAIKINQEGLVYVTTCNFENV
jgi:hypothetical protein